MENPCKFSCFCHVLPPPSWSSWHFRWPPRRMKYGCPTPGGGLVQPVLVGPNQVSRRCPFHHQGIYKVTYQIMFQLNVYRHVFLHLQIRQFIRYADAISAISDSIKLRCDSSFDRRGLGDTKQVAMKLEAPLGGKSDTRGEHTKQGHRESVSNPWWRNYNTAVLGCRWTSIAGHAMRFQRWKSANSMASVCKA